MQNRFATMLLLCCAATLAQTPPEAQTAGQKELYAREMRTTRECMQEELSHAWATGIRSPRQLQHRMSEACSKVLQVLVFDNFRRKDLSARINGIVSYLAWDELRHTPGVQSLQWKGNRPCTTYECAVAPLP